MHFTDKTICAISSPAGVGAISTIRLSGNNAIGIVEKIILNSEKYISAGAGKMVFCKLVKPDKSILDEVLISKFIAPHSFTGEDMVEIYCHGSQYIQKELLNLLIDNGASIAQPGEFTKRAFFNGKMDLSQSEAVADIISSDSSESHRIAISQMKGSVSSEIRILREKMIDLTALMELELDFGEEDVEFADRSSILALISEMQNRIKSLISSFRYGNAIKSGVPVVIAGEPNTGKSTLLNALLNEERAIVSAIPGTTRDTIEEELILDGIKFRIIDTAGIRNSSDEIEEIGIKRSFEKIDKAQLILLIIEANQPVSESVNIINEIKSKLRDDQHLIIVINKIDLLKNQSDLELFLNENQIAISAATKQNIDLLCNKMTDYIKSLKVGSNDVIISSARHVESLIATSASLDLAVKALNNNLSGDFVSQDLREAMHFLGEITGQVNNEEVLGAIFARFCIGK
jgi:tRNA modification GTPase